MVDTWEMGLDSLRTCVEQIRTSIETGFANLQAAINALALQVGQINGRVRHVEDRSDSHSKDLDDLRGVVGAHVAKLAELEAINQVREQWYQAERARLQQELEKGEQRALAKANHVEAEMKAGQAALWSRLWDITQKVFKIGEALAVIAAVLKLAGVW
jgi:chromosome segregation ATPase